MLKKSLIVFVLWCGLSSFVSADECVASEAPLIDILNQYSAANGTKFIVDPRARAKVSLVGVDTESINTAMLIGILNMHGFTALTSEGVVYVMPYKVAESSGEKFGVTWEG